MKKYGWQAVYLSFFSGDLYRDVAKNWKGVAYLYLLCISLVFSVFSAVGVQFQANEMIGKHVEPVVAKWPSLTLANGEFSMDKPSPYIIETNDNYIVDFDMRENAQIPAGKRGWLITKTAVRANGVGTNNEENKDVFDASSFKSSASGSAPIVIDQPAVQFWIGIGKSCIGVFVLVFRTIQLLLVGMIESLIYGLIGLAVASAMKVELSYATLMRLSVVALTPGMVIETIAMMVGKPIPLWGLISIPLAIGYMIYGIKSSSASEPPITAL